MKFFKTALPYELRKVLKGAIMKIVPQEKARAF
jgi:hypothetical protein